MGAMVAAMVAGFCGLAKWRRKTRSGLGTGCRRLTGFLGPAILLVTVLFGSPGRAMAASANGAPLAVSAGAGTGASVLPASRLLGFFLQRPALVSGPPVVSGSAFSDTAGSPAEGEFVLLAALGIFRGESGPSGPVHPQRLVTRQDLAIIAVRMLGYEQVAAWYREKGGDLPFVDAEEIPRDLRGHIRVAVNLGLVRGLPAPDGSLLFAGRQPITLRDAVTVLLRALKNDTLPGAGWPADAELALRDAIRARVDKDASEPITREDMAILVANALFVGRYDALEGRFNPSNRLVSSVFSLYEGTVLEADLFERRIYLRSAGDGQAQRLWLASQVFLRGASSVEGLAGRDVMAVVGRDGGVVYIEAR